MNLKCLACGMALKENNYCNFVCHDCCFSYTTKDRSGHQIIYVFCYFDIDINLQKVVQFNRGNYSYRAMYYVDTQFLKITDVNLTKYYYNAKFNINNVTNIVKFSQKLLKNKIFI